MTGGTYNGIGGERRPQERHHRRPVVPRHEHAERRHHKKASIDFKARRMRCS